MPFLLAYFSRILLRSHSAILKNTVFELNEVICDMAPLNLEQDGTKANCPGMDSHSMLDMFDYYFT